MNFLEAIEFLKEGKKIVNSDWDSPNYYLKLVDGLVVGFDGDIQKNEQNFAITDFESDGWLIVADTTLSYKIRDFTTINTIKEDIEKGKFIHVEDVKESLKKFRNWMGWKDGTETNDYKCPKQMSEIYCKLKEIFGEELL